MGFSVMRNSIYYQMMIEGKRISINTGLTTRNWVKSEQRVSKVEDFFWEKNQRLDRIEREMDRLKIKARVEGFIPDKKILQDWLKNLRNSNQEERIIFVHQFIRDYQKDKANQLKPNTLRKYTSLADDLEKSFPLVTFDRLDEEFFTQWIDEFLEKDLLNSTIAGKVRNLKTVIKYAQRKGIHVNGDAMEFHYRDVRYEPIFLDWDRHIISLENIELEGTEDKIRDRFLFRCYTGIREGEMNTLSPESFYKSGGKLNLRYWDSKGRKTKVIRLSSRAEGLVNKYSFDLPKYSQQTENNMIKDVLCKAGVNEMRQKIRHSGPKALVKMVPLCDLVSSHTARRTFARRWYEQGGDLKKLSKYLGHSSIRTTEIYVGVEDGEVNDEMERIFG